ncbi:hypothetical protein V1279_003357 [Bradyrhizobium sp. AZCC 1610]
MDDADTIGALLAAFLVAGMFAASIWKPAGK